MKEFILPALMVLFTVGTSTSHAKQNSDMDFAPLEHETTAFTFKDCNGKEFNTQNPEDIQTSNIKCVYEGIIATKFDVNGVQKSISEMTVKELDLYRASVVDVRALFAVTFYDTMHSPELIHQIYPIEK
ncbi:hypothetical protein AMD27_17605 (plasmid) [Acinetobacter sp. TGL-Y2]|uniref:hypothetical protein n=1 Tax=Acinetobacter sp. TGL-Y2 TaxID=1407071 RepID=UPI0007A67C72|nr:hypothetical protein [Acinetobacter sp. TGL-Y2]AMW80732.1 hypothetical protein AMD27_17605 [Acinetobacter sp. TGL-Y2]